MNDSLRIEIKRMLSTLGEREADIVRLYFGIDAPHAFTLEEIGENYGYVGRNGGNEFIILLDNCDSAASDLFLADITKRIQGYNEMNVGAPMEISYARVFNCEFHADKMSQLISQGYRKLIEAPQTLS